MRMKIGGGKDGGNTEQEEEMEESAGFAEGRRIQTDQGEAGAKKKSLRGSTADKIQKAL